MPKGKLRQENSVKLRRRGKSEFIREKSPYSQMLNEGGGEGDEESKKEAKVDFE